MKNIRPYIIGTGLVLFVVNQPSVKGILISNIGLCLIYMGILASLWRINWRDVGSKYVWIPLAVLASTIAISAITSDLTNKVSIILFAPTLFALYVVGRNYKGKLFVPFAYGVIITSVSLVIAGFINPGIKQGGLISPTNYDMATGFLIFGTLVCVWRKQWILTSIALIGLFFTGADEAIFSVGVIFLTVLIRRDFSRKLILPIAALLMTVIIATPLMTVIIATPLGITEELYSPTAQKVECATEGEWLEATGYRVTGNWKISDLKLFGNGYYINWDSSYIGKIPHNVPLIIVEQVGILGALAWCWVTLYCLFKTKMKYAWIGVLSLCVFDHYIFTQACVWWPVLVGVSTSVGITNDRIYAR